MIMFRLQIQGESAGLKFAGATVYPTLSDAVEDLVRLRRDKLSASVQKRVDDKVGWETVPYHEWGGIAIEFEKKEDCCLRAEAQDHRERTATGGGGAGTKSHRRGGAKVWSGVDRD